MACTEQPGIYRHAFGYNAEETSRISKANTQTNELHLASTATNKTV